MANLITAQYDGNKNQVLDPNSRGTPVVSTFDPVTGWNIFWSGGVAKRAEHFGAPNVSTSAAATSVLKLVTLPKEILTPNTAILIKSLWMGTGVAAQKYENIVLNNVGAGLSGGQGFLSWNFTTQRSLQADTVIYFQNSLSTQIGGNESTLGAGQATSALTTSAFDGSQGLDLMFAGSCVNAADAIALRGYNITVLNP